MKNLILYTAVVVAAASSCQKPDNTRIVKVTTSDTTYNLVNKSSRTIMVNMYTSATDRDNETNLRYTCEVPANNIFKIPFSKVDTSFSTVYYYDVHSSDQMYSNWGGYSYGYALFSSGHAFDLSQLTMTKARYYFLHGDNATIMWRAIDKRNSDNTSVWPSLNNYERYLTVVLNKNKRGTVTRKQSDGTLDVGNITGISADSTYYGFTRLSVNTNGFSSTYVFYNSAIAPDANYDAITSKDTVTLYDYNYYWVLIPQ